MSTDDAAASACRQLLESQLQAFTTSRSASESTPVSEAECVGLIEDLQKVWTRTKELSWSLDPAPTDTALRDLLFDIISRVSINDPEFGQTWYLIDIATILSDNDLSEPASNVQLVEYLLDSQTVSGCRKVFDYLESRRDRLIAKNFDKKNLIILRCCNELLRRLSRAEDTVFCGRVFIFLFQSFPLGDKSSVNLRGQFHTENATHFDLAPKKSEDAITPMELDTDSARPVSSGGQTPLSNTADAEASQKAGRSTPIPSKLRAETKAQEAPPDLDTLFPEFWSLQKLFSQPTRLFEAASMAQFKEGMSATLACFKSIATSTSASSNTADSVRGTKRKRSEMNGTRVAQPYNPKYLTNRDLFDLEIHDLAFRRHILAQSLIMLDFLLSLSSGTKAKTQSTGNNKSVLYTYKLGEEDTKYCQSMRQSIATYLQQQGPGNDGKSYYRMVDTVLTRDKNWARWKAESCPPISKPAVDIETFATTQKTLTDMTAKKAFANPPGANDFSFLSHAEPLEALKHPSERRKIPTLEDYYKSIETDKLDEDFATDEEKKELQEQIQGKLWRALRASALSGQRFEICEKIKDGANLKALIGQDEEPVKDEEPETEAQTDSNGSKEENTVDTSMAQVDGAADTPDAEPEAKVEAEDDVETPQEATATIGTHVGDAEPEEADDGDEFAPPGAMDLDEAAEAAKEVTVSTEDALTEDTATAQSEEGAETETVS